MGTVKSIVVTAILGMIICSSAVAMTAESDSDAKFAARLSCKQQALAQMAQSRDSVYGVRWSKRFQGEAHLSNNCAETCMLSASYIGATAK